MKRIIHAGGVALAAALIIFTATACAAKPEKVLKQMIANLAAAESFNLELNLGAHGQFPQLTTLNASEAQILPGAIIFNLHGPVNVKQALEYHLTGSAKYRLQESEIQFLGDLIYQNATLFFKLTEIPNVKAVDLSNLKNNWYKFDFNSLGLGQQLAEADNKGIDEEKTSQMRKLVRQTDFFQVISDNGIDNLNGQPMHHYNIKLNQAEIKTFFEKASEIFEERKLTEVEEQELDENLAVWGGIVGQVWIGVKDVRLYRLETASQSESSESGTLRYDVAIGLGDYNGNFSVEAPQNVREFNMAELFLPSLGALSAVEGVDAQEIKLEDQFKQIPGVNPEDLQKQLEDLKKGLEQNNN